MMQFQANETTAAIANGVISFGRDTLDLFLDTKQYERITPGSGTSSRYRFQAYREILPFDRVAKKKQTGCRQAKQKPY